MLDHPTILWSLVWKACPPLCKLIKSSRLYYTSTVAFFIINLTHQIGNRPCNCKCIPVWWCHCDINEGRNALSWMESLLRKCKKFHSAVCYSFSSDLMVKIRVTHCSIMRFCTFTWANQNIAPCTSTHEAMVTAHPLDSTVQQGKFPKCLSETHDCSSCCLLLV